MKDTNLLLALEDLGLSEKEAAVYYASLSLGPASVLNISKTSGVKRSTVYSVIESLRRQKLIRKEIRGVKEYFTAEAPERLRSVLEKRQESFISILPQLSALHRLEGAESVIKYYEGIDAIKDIYLDFIRSVKIGEDYLVLTDIDRWRKHAPAFFDDFAEHRGKLDIKVRMILLESPLAIQRRGPLRQPNEETRLLPKGTFLATNLVIIPSKALIQQLEPPVMGMVIENKNIIQMHTEMFELIWRGLRA